MKKRSQTTFRSGLESKISTLLDASLLTWTHESETLKYVQPEQIRRYNPDFRIKKFPKLIIEAKGIFSSDDRKKMLLIKEQYPDRIIVMIFGRSQNPIRKGSKTTYAAWCDANEIAWLDLNDFRNDPTKYLTAIARKRKPKIINETKKAPCHSRHTGSTRKNNRTSKMGRAICRF